MTKGTCITLHSVSIDNERIRHKRDYFMNTLILMGSSFPNAELPTILSLRHLLADIIIMFVI